MVVRYLKCADAAVLCHGAADVALYSVTKVMLLHGQHKTLSRGVVHSKKFLIHPQKKSEKNPKKSKKIQKNPRIFLRI